jgi:hypothetical protein
MNLILLKMSLMLIDKYVVPLLRKGDSRISKIYENRVLGRILGLVIED